MKEKEFAIHNFSQKLLQRSVFPHLKAYLAKKGNDLAPISINLDLVTACNFQCPHCIDQELINTGKMLDFAYVKTLLHDWSKKGLKSVILIGGGEPALYPHFEKAVELLKNLRLQVGIVSNGTKLGKIENICHLLDSKDWVRLSLDAGKDETFRKIHEPRVKIKLEEILAGVKKIRQKNADLQLGFSFLIIGDKKYAGKTLLANNIREISLAAKLAKESGFSYLSLKPFIDPSGARKTSISQKNLREIKEEIKKAKKFQDHDFKIIESINLLCFYDKNLKKMMMKQPKTCHAQFFRGVVIPAGIFSCSLWRGFDNMKIGKTNEKIGKDYYDSVYGNRKKILKTFVASKTCKEISCLYAPFNCWVEELLKSPKKIKELKAIDDFSDYFL